MAILKTQALYNFFSGFELPVYEENTVPTGANAPALPYITYSTATSGFDNNVQISASLWYKGFSWADADRKAAEINTALANGGKKIPYTGGALWIKDTLFAQHMPDDDDTIRRIYLNLTAEYL